MYVDADTETVSPITITGPPNFSLGFGVRILHSTRRSVQMERRRSLLLVDFSSPVLMPPIGETMLL